MKLLILFAFFLIGANANAHSDFTAVEDHTNIVVSLDKRRDNGRTKRVKRRNRRRCKRFGKRMYAG